MINNDDRMSPPTFNFTVFTGDTVPNRELGPTRDHTNNSTSGGFLYWNRELPFTSTDFGRVYPSTTIEQNLGMCVKFAYYVKSLAVNKNGTTLGISTGGCYGASLWYHSLDDSQGWQTVIVPVKNSACAETFYFGVNQRQPIPVAVAFDDIEIDQCSSISPTTTTSSTTTSTSTITTTTTTTTTTTSLSSTASTTMSTPTITMSSSTSTTTYIPITTTPNNGHRLLSLSLYNLVFLWSIFREFF